MDIVYWLQNYRNGNFDSEKLDCNEGILHSGVKHIIENWSSFSDYFTLSSQNELLFKSEISIDIRWEISKHLTKEYRAPTYVCYELD